MWAQPTVLEFQQFFVRDFPYAPVDDDANLDYIGSADITKAISEALMTFTSGLYGTDAESTIAFMYLAAFHMVEDLKTSAKGMAAVARFPQDSESVGSVSISNAISQRYKDHAILGQYLVNAYGKKYLEFTEPYLAGNIGIAAGTTTY